MFMANRSRSAKFNFKGDMKLIPSLDIKQKHRRLKAIIIYDRKSSCPKYFKNKTVLIRNGLSDRTLFLKKFFRTFKFGEFSFTRKSFYFPKVVKKKKKLYRY